MATPGGEQAAEIETQREVAAAEPDQAAASKADANDDDEDEILGTGPSPVDVSKDEEDELLGPSADNNDNNDSTATTTTATATEQGASTMPGETSGDQEESASGLALKRKRLEEDGGDDAVSGEKNKKSSVASDFDTQDQDGEESAGVQADSSNKEETEMSEAENVAKDSSEAAKDQSQDKTDEKDSEKDQGEGDKAAAESSEPSTVSTAASEAPKPSANKGFDMFKASPFAALSGTGASPFASVSTSGASPFATFAGTKSAFGQLASQNGTSTTFGSSSAGGASAFGSSGSSSGSSNNKSEDKGEADESKAPSKDGAGDENGSSEVNDAVNDEKNAVFGGVNSQANETSAEATEVITGEEGEDCIYRVRARLYRLTAISEEDETPSQSTEAAASKTSTTMTSSEDAKKTTPSTAPKTAGVKRAYREMGAGTVHINVSQGSEWDAQKTSQPPRLVMRREGVLKLLLNAVMWKAMPLERASDKVVRFTCKSVIDDADASQGPETYLFKVAREDQCEEFYKALLKARDMCP